MGKLIFLMSGAIILGFCTAMYTYAAFFNPDMNVPMKMISTVLAVVCWIATIRVLLWETLPERWQAKVVVWWMKMKGDL